jgi:hypothetical protein
MHRCCPFWLPKASKCLQKVPFPPKWRLQNEAAGANGRLMSPATKSQVPGTLCQAQTGVLFCLDMLYGPQNRQKTSKLEVSHEHLFLRWKTR